MTEENKKEEKAVKRLRKQFTDTLLNSDIDKKVISTIIGDEATFLTFFKVYLLGCKDMHGALTKLSQAVIKSNEEGTTDEKE